MDALDEALTAYVDAAKAALTPKPGRVVHVVPGGEVAWDGDCTGQLYARVIRVEPYVPPRPAVNYACGVPYMIATVAVGILRCVAVLDDNGVPPKPAKLDVDGRQMLADMGVLQDIILCREQTRRVMNWTPLGPAGAYAGGEWQFQLYVETCGCDDG